VRGSCQPAAFAVSVPRRPRRCLVTARRRRARDRTAGPGARRQARRGRGDRARAGRARPRSGPPGPLHQHAAGAQADLADERRRAGHRRVGRPRHWTPRCNLGHHDSDSVSTTVRSSLS